VRRARFNGWALLWAALAGASVVIGYLTALRGDWLGVAGLVVSLLLCACLVALNGGESDG
jgi:CHASE2 domain-containing sensor protein